MPRFAALAGLALVLTAVRSGAAEPDDKTHWSATMYGFIEADSIYDSTRSFDDRAGAQQVARPETLEGRRGRFTMGARNSRLGVRVRPPGESLGEFRVTGKLEVDLLGTQRPIGSGEPYFGSEGAFFTSPTLRVRHANIEIETPIVDVLIGQSWQLFGWQSTYHLNSVEIQGVPGQLYARTPQIRVSKAVEDGPLGLEIAVAATRPVQRDSGVPDGQAGLRLSFEDWRGMQTMGAATTTLSPMSVALTGYVRRLSVDELSDTPTRTHDAIAGGVAVDAFVPILPATEDDKENALSLNAEYATGYGGADMYTGLSGGASYPPLPARPGAPAPTYDPNIDPGIVTYDRNGRLHAIEWTSWLVGVQYYLPAADGRAWISMNYSHHESANLGTYGGDASELRLRENWYDVNLFVDVTSALRVGLEQALFDDQYRDGVHARSWRTQLSAFYLF